MNAISPLPVPALPSVFLSHGSPMLAVEDSPAGRFLDGLGAQLPRPRAIVVVSAHFMAEAPAIGTAIHPETVHDFGGFPSALYQITYPAPGAPELAAEIASRLEAAGLAPSLRPHHGLDHGVWVPLRRMYPEAGLPVVPISVSPHRDAAWHHALGRALAPLRAQGVLVIGSGGFVHNLGDLDWRHRDAPLAPWSRDFRDWMTDRIAASDTDALLDWAHQAPNPRRAHPTTEHLMPLFVAMGASGETATAHHLHDSYELGTLALDAFAFD